MDSIILAGGFAKRMLPLTKDIPKQLLKVGNKPMLSHVLSSLEKVNPDRVIISVNSLFESNFEKFVDSYEGSLNLQIFVEPSFKEEEKLGALGALNLIFTKLEIRGPIFIVGGDNLSDFDLRLMKLSFERTKKDIIGLYDVENYNLASLYGIANQQDDRIIDFIEKPKKPQSTLAATAYWILSESGVSNFFDYIKSGGNRDAMGNFLAWNVKRHDVRSVAFKGRWFDIGSLESYDDAQNWVSG